MSETLKKNMVIQVVRHKKQKHNTTYYIILFISNINIGKSSKCC